MEIYGTIGPACLDVKILKEMFQEGMTGIRLNLSHITLKDAEHMISIYQEAAKEAGMKKPGLLIDMQGPEIRIGNLKEELILNDGESIMIGPDGIPVEESVQSYLKIGQEVLLDDGKILLKVCKESPLTCQVLRGGLLSSRKSLALVGKSIPSPALTKQDLTNLLDAKAYGVTGIMQPFVRSRDDLLQVRQAMKEADCEDLKLFAKIENTNGVDMIEDFLDLADEIVIARGDLGNAMPLWELPHVQKQISDICKKHSTPFMVVTQMLSSMEKNAVPTRAEVSDIYYAALSGAASVMVTGETAVGRYPVEVIRYLAKTAESGHRDAMHYMLHADI